LIFPGPDLKARSGERAGAGLETDEAVREAAYGYQPDEQLSEG
jgi:hypothetical protein